LDLHPAQTEDRCAVGFIRTETRGPTESGTDWAGIGIGIGGVVFGILVIVGACFSYSRFCRDWCGRRIPSDGGDRHVVESQPAAATPSRPELSEFEKRQNAIAGTSLYSVEEGKVVWNPMWSLDNSCQLTHISSSLGPALWRLMLRAARDASSLSRP
jgi:hypothetical protein